MPVLCRGPGKLLRIVGRVIVAAPAVIEAVKPVLRKRHRPKVVPDDQVDAQHGNANGVSVTTERP